MPPPLVLDLDGSLDGLQGALRVGLQHWQEAVRFGCGMATWRRFATELRAALPASHGTVFMGSGDFHHVTHLLLENLAQQGPFDVVVLDNHPDNMRFPFGIHCGSWVHHAAALPGIGTVHVVGITSADVSLAHAWENHLLPLYRGKVRYWTLGVDTGWTARVGLANACRAFQDSASLIDALLANLDAQARPVYLSIDKDVLSPSVARTNWDQGRMELPELERLTRHLAGRHVGSDVTGEISAYRYQSRWKRWLSALDDQPEVSGPQLAAWQAQQQAVNRQLLAWLSGST